MNFIKKFIGTSQTDEIVSIPSGKLFLTRSPQSPKGELECLYNDAFASIRQTTTPFYYQLCITRVYQEGELDGHGSSGFDDSDEDEDDFSEHDSPHSLSDVNSGSGNSKDEWSFPIMENLKIHSYVKSDGSRAIAWMDLNGDIGDKFEFIVDEDVKLNKVDAFLLALYKCLYESKYHKISTGIENMSQLKEFEYHPKSELLTFDDLKSSSILEYDEEEEEEEDEEVEEEVEEDEIDEEDDFDDESSLEEFYDAKTSLPALEAKQDYYTPPKGTTFYETRTFDLHLFDSELGAFKLQVSSPNVILKITDLGDWEYSLDISSNENSINFHSIISQNMNPTFNYDYLSFIFNCFVFKEGDITAYSWLLKFSKFDDLSEFQNNFMRTMWESLNKTKWGKTSEVDQDYVIDAFSGLSIDDDSSDKDEIDQMSDDEDVLDSEDENAIDKLIDRKTHGDKYKNDDESDDENKEYSSWRSQSDKNSNLSVGYANDRSYVVRGNKLGVFSNENDELNYQTTISNLKDLKGFRFNPEKMMLHQQDQYMIMSDSKVDNSKLYKMDLTRGKIVEEWTINEDSPIVSYGPNSKFSQLTDEPTLIGISPNGLFRIDPRLSGSKLVNDNTYKFYITNHKFSSLATTEQGYLAVGSEKGDIRLYDKLGTNAKTALPSLGESIIGLDVSNDGRWLLATCKSYLLLIDTKAGKDQRNEGSLVFTKPFDKDKKPTPRRLAIRPEHISYMLTETKEKSLNFTKAYFNTGINSKETSIVTSSGPYVITWSLKKVLLGDPEPYLIKRYQQKVIADNFKFGSNQDVILALQDDVSMINKKSLKKPNKGSFIVKDYY